MFWKERKKAPLRVGEWIVLAPRSPRCLIVILLRKENADNNYVLNINILLLDRYPFPESENNAISKVSNLVNCLCAVITMRDAPGMEKER